MGGQYYRDNALASAAVWLRDHVARTLRDDRIEPLEDPWPFWEEVLRALTLPPEYSHMSDSDLARFALHQFRRLPENGGLWRECRLPDYPAGLCGYGRDLMIDVLEFASICLGNSELKSQTSTRWGSRGETRFAPPMVDVHAEMVFIGGLRKLRAATNWKVVQDNLSAMRLQLALIPISLLF